MGLEEKFGYCLNLAIFLFSTAVMSYAAYSIYVFNTTDEDTLYSKSDYAWLLAGGILGMFLALFACYAIQNQQRNYNMLFIYFLGLSIILLINVAGAYFYITFTSALDTSNDGNIEAAVKTEIAQELSDYILSTYTTCCTGCDTGLVPECKSSFGAITDEVNTTNFCPRIGLDVADNTTDCQVATLCTGIFEDKLGGGCYINAKEIPSYAIGSTTCDFLQDYAVNSADKPIVGDFAQGSCGGGNPIDYVEDTKQYLLANKSSIMAFLIITLIILGLTWLGTFKMLLCPELDDRNTLIGYHK